MVMSLWPRFLAHHVHVRSPSADLYYYYYYYYGTSSQRKELLRAVAWCSWTAECRQLGNDADQWKAESLGNKNVPI